MNIYCKNVFKLCLSAEAKINVHLALGADDRLKSSDLQFNQLEVSRKVLQLPKI